MLHLGASPPKDRRQRQLVCSPKYENAWRGPKAAYQRLRYFHPYVYIKCIVFDTVHV